MDKKIVIIGNIKYRAYVDEYIDSIKNKLQCDEQFFYSNTIPSSLNFKSDNVIYIIYYPLDGLINKYDNVYFINAEQLSINKYYNDIKTRIDNGIKYITIILKTVYYYHSIVHIYLINIVIMKFQN